MGTHSKVGCAEIKWVVKNYKTRMVEFADDEFIFDKNWLEEFFIRYNREIRLPFSCLVRINLITEDVAKLLKDSGCVTVHFGIETGNEKLRNELLNKNLKNEDIIRGAAILKRFGLKINTFNMLNIPGETIENGFETVEINQRIKADYPWCSIIQPFPGTELLDMVVKTNNIQSESIIDNLDFYAKSIIEQKDSKKLMNLEKLFYLSVKFPFLNPIIKIVIQLPPQFYLFFDFHCDVWISTFTSKQTYHV